MVRWMMVGLMFPLVLGAGAAYGDTWGTMAPPGSGWRATPSIFDPLDNYQPDPTYFDGVDIYPGVWWQRAGSYEYFRMDLAGLPNGENPSDWASMYSILLDTGPGGGSPFDSSGPLPESDHALAMVFHSLPAGDTDTNLDLAAVLRWEWSAVEHTWLEFEVMADTDEFFIEFTPSNQTLQWRVPLATIGGNPSYRFAGSTLTSNYYNVADMTEWGVTPEPASMALMSLGLIGLVALRKRRRED